MESSIPQPPSASFPKPPQIDMRKISFLVSQAYSTYNKGEVAIGMSIIESIRRIFPNADISIMTPAPRQAVEQYSQYKVEIHSKLFSSSGSRTGASKLVHSAGIILKIAFYLISTKFNIPLDDLVLFRNADVVVIAGGGTFGGSKYRSISGNLFQIYLAKMLKKKVIVYGPSVEPFTSKVVRLLTRIAFNRADLITVREQHTLDLLTSLDIKAPIYLTADPAFLIGHESIESGAVLLKNAGVPIKETDFMIGVTIRDWDFPKQQNSTQIRIQYLSAIKYAIEKVLESRNNTSIVIFTTSINSAFNDDDRVTATKIRDAIPENFRKRVFVLTADYTPQQIKAMIANMGIFIATRFHSAVFGLSMNIPVMMIATEPNKNRGIMEMMDLEDYLLDASSISGDSVFLTMNKLIDQRDSISQKIAMNLPIIKSKAIQNEEFLRQLCANL